MAKILIVDDAAFMRKVIRDTLTKNGFTCTRRWTARMLWKSILNSSRIWS